MNFDPFLNGQALNLGKNEPMETISFSPMQFGQNIWGGCCFLIQMAFIPF